MTEVEDLRNELEAMEKFMDYERNKYIMILKSQRKEIAARLYSHIELEIEAIEDIARYIDEADRRRICRRLTRIKQYLQDFEDEQY